MDTAARPKRTPRVVVGVDGSPGARTALVQAVTTAARRGATLEVVVASPPSYVYTGGHPVDVPDEEAQRSHAEIRAREFLDDVRRELSGRVPGADALDVHVVVQEGTPVPVLLRAVEDGDLLVVGSRGRGAMRSALLGSVALHCVTHAQCPVVVAHADPDLGREARVVVGVDGSPGSRAAVDAAVEEAVRVDAELDLVACFELTDYWTDMPSAIIPSIDDIREDLRRRSEAILEDALAARPEAAPVPETRVTVVEGPADDVLVDRARHAELLVVGSQGHGALRALLLGSVALQCAMHASVPVMVVRPGHAGTEPERARTQPALSTG